MHVYVPDRKAWQQQAYIHSYIFIRNGLNTYYTEWKLNFLFIFCLGIKPKNDIFCNEIQMDYNSLNAVCKIHTRFCLQYDNIQFRIVGFTESSKKYFSNFQDCFYDTGISKNFLYS